MRGYGCGCVGRGRWGIAASSSRLSGERGTVGAEVADVLAGMELAVDLGKVKHCGEALSKNYNM